MIDLDAAATTPTLPAVAEAMRPYLDRIYGNPSSAHALGRKARQALDDCRQRIAARLGAFADEVVFTSGATEANNLAIFGSVNEPGAMIVSSIEHPCVTEPARQLVKRGFHIIEPPVDANGIVTCATVPDVRLIAVQLVNHETGVLQPIAALRALHEVIAFHCDAAQAVGKLPVDFHTLGVTTLAVSGHKFGGPKGVGVLLVSRCAPVTAQLFGGHQQHGRRPGTESVPLAVGLATALDIACENMERHRGHVSELRTAFLTHLHQHAGPMRVNGEGSPYIVNVSFPGVRAELLLMKLDMAEVAASTGSACSSGSLLPSPVLRAMGVPEEALRSAMRFGFRPDHTLAEVSLAAERVAVAVRALRATVDVPFRGL